MSINSSIISPKSIVVIGASNILTKPGGKLVKNLLDGQFSGPLYAVNPKEDSVQGIQTFKSVNDLPEVDLAILAIPPHPCKEAIKVLAKQKNTKGFIIISAGFSEGDDEGKRIETEMGQIKVGVCSRRRE